MEVVKHWRALQVAVALVTGLAGCADAGSRDASEHAAPAAHSIAPHVAPLLLPPNMQGGRIELGADDTATAMAPTMAGSEQLGEASPAERPTCAEALQETRSHGSIGHDYVAPSKADRKEMRLAIEELVARGAAARPGAEERLARIGFHVNDVADQPGVVIVRESDGHRRGGGAYVLRLDGASRLVVEAPHTFHDERTFELACDFFRAQHARAFFFNTTHRYRGAAAGRDGVHPSDVAHAPGSFFQAATKGAVDAVGDATVIQLHGFTARTADVRTVISTGESEHDNAHLGAMKTLLEEASGAGVARFPDDTNDLGATKNVQASLVRAAGGTFLHVEMSGELRRELFASEAKRTRVWRALAQESYERR
jgi:hypothetical protein